MNIFDHIFVNKGFIFITVLIWVVQISFTYLGGNFLRTVGLTLDEWGIVLSTASLILPFDALRKMIYLRFVKTGKHEREKLL